MKKSFNNKRLKNVKFTPRDSSSESNSEKIEFGTKEQSEKEKLQFFKKMKHPQKRPDGMFGKRLFIEPIHSSGNFPGERKIILEDGI